MSQEIRGNDNARIIKIIASLMMIASVVIGPFAASEGVDNVAIVAFIMFLVGLFGFCVGRFME